MKSLLILSILVLTIPFSAHANRMIISDVDDTIKMSDVLGKKSRLVYNALMSDKAFSGMSELYQAMDLPDTSFYYVSGSPRIIRCRIEDFLKENEFPQTYNTILKKHNDKDTLNYKIDSIRSLIIKESPNELILIGDDTQYDPEVYETISREFPELVKAIYIRSIQNRKIRVGKTFFSAVEIAAHEVNAGRMKPQFLAPVTFGFTNQTHRSGVVLRSRYCPKEGSEAVNELKNSSDDNEVIELLERTQTKIITTCK